jgi:hypothetical protein
LLAPVLHTSGQARDLIILTDIPDWGSYQDESHPDNVSEEFSSFVLSFEEQKWIQNLQSLRLIFVKAVPRELRRTWSLLLPGVSMSTIMSSNISKAVRHSWSKGSRNMAEQEINILLAD